MNPEGFRNWILEDPATRVPPAFIVLGVLLVVPLFGFVAYIWRMTQRITAERRFPPSGYRVIGNKPPVTGDEALRSARILRALAMFLLAAAVMLVFQLWRFVMLLRTQI